jgi:N-terminal C2 in EEIG1 and EHBP1 proteins
MLTKSSRPKLKLSLQIHELSSVPLVTGQVFVKWHILNSSSADCRGKTDRVPIVDHKSSWSDYQRECMFKVGIGRNGVLQERMLMMEVWVEMISGRERFRIGHVGVNLSEYASVKRETRRYLLQESKMNSTVKVTISVVHVEGSKEYSTPPLKKAQMFHGITNLLAENKDLPQISRVIEKHNISKTEVHSPWHEMYRRTFTAMWRLQVGELPPGDVVEDIFRGGSGWKGEGPQNVVTIPDPKPHRRTDSNATVRPSVRDLRRPPTSLYTNPALRYQRSHIPYNRPITPMSPDDASDDDDEGEDWIRSEIPHPSHKLGHLRTASLVSIGPRQHRRGKERSNVITSENWEKEELETTPRSWKTPKLEVLEEKIEMRRAARDSRSSSSNGTGSEPVSVTTTSNPSSRGTFNRTASYNGSILSQVVLEDDDHVKTKENGH